MAWKNDKCILYSLLSQPDKIFQFNMDNATVDAIALPTQDALPFSFCVLGNGQVVLFQALTTTWVHLFATGKSRPLMTGQRGLKSLTYTDDGYLLYGLWQTSTLLARPFDAEKCEFTGPERLVLEGIDEFAVSGDGTLYYYPQRQFLDFAKIYRYDLDRESPPQLYSTASGRFRRLAIARDGRVILQVDETAAAVSPNLAVLRRDRLLGLVDDATAPKCSADGRSIYYAHFDPEKFEWQGIFQCRFDGTDDAVRIDKASRPCYPESVSPDEKYLFVSVSPEESSEGSNWSIGRISLTDDQETIHVWRQNAGESAVSPDSRWVAFGTLGGGIFVKSITGDGPEIPISSSETAKSPMWSSDNVIYYRAATDSGPVLMRVTVTTNESVTQPTGVGDLEFGEPEFVLNLPIGDDNFEITPDGKSLLVIESYERGEDSAVIHKVRSFLKLLEEKTGKES
jgi:hypothetical protein